MALTVLALCGITGAAVGAAVWRAPGRPLWRSLVGSGALVAAAFVLASTVGRDIELRWMANLPASALGAQWLAWVAVALLAVLGALALQLRRDPAWETRTPLHPKEFGGLAIGTFMVALVIVFALPVWDLHVNGWTGDYHGHTYYGRRLHFH